MPLCFTGYCNRLVAVVAFFDCVLTLQDGWMDETSPGQTDRQVGSSRFLRSKSTQGSKRGRGRERERKEKIAGNL